MDTDSVDLSIVIPAFNEEKTIAFCITKARRAIQNLLSQKVTAEIIVANNASSDSTARVAKQLGARVEEVSKKGYGNAVIGGIRAAKGKYVLFADADDSYDFGEIQTFYDKLKTGYDFVMGNRFKGKIEKGAMPFLHRYLGTPVLTAIMNLFFKTGIGDCNCGMRAMTREAFHKMRLRAAGMEFATEMVVKASLLRLKIAEVPCNLYLDKRGKKSHLRTWRDGWRHLRFLLLFTPTWTFFIPGLLLGGAGVLGMLFIFWRDCFQPDMALFLSQKHILSSMLLFLSGCQILELGLIAKAFSFSKHFDHASKVIRYLDQYFRLERGILAGLVLMLTSSLIFLYLLISFYSSLLPFMNDIIRLDFAIFAITLFLLGLQCIFLSFVLSLFYLRVK